MDIALIRGTYADEDGNCSMCKEAATLDSISIAQAVKNSGGKVILQVEKIVERGSLKPMDVKIPGIYVDQSWLQTMKITGKLTQIHTIHHSVVKFVYQLIQLNQCP